MAKHAQKTSTANAGGTAAVAGVEPVAGGAKKPTSVVQSAISPAASGSDDIARLAYTYWQARGCPAGSPEEDWLRAESDLQEPSASKRRP